MELFLKSCKDNLALLKSSSNTSVHIVLGTEACDLDSAVSSTVYAYLLSLLYSLRTDTFIVPVLNIQRSALDSRKDILYVFKKAGISTDSFTFKNEIPLKDLADKGQLEVTLVDHNLLAPQDIFLEDLVTQIIDHHKDERVLKHKKLNCIIESVGSCATLIAAEMLKNHSKEISKEIAILIHHSILLDTSNLSEEAKRVTPQDICITEEMETILGKLNRTEIFTELQNAKFDISGLTFGQVLFKDLKITTNDTLSIAIPSMTMLLENVPDMASQLGHFCQENCFDIAVLMGITFNKSQLKRELIIFSPERTKDALALVQFLQNAKNPDLNLIWKPIDFCGSELLVVFEQLNTEASRKIVLPLIRTFLNTLNLTTTG